MSTRVTANILRKRSFGACVFRGFHTKSKEVKATAPQKTLEKLFFIFEELKWRLTVRQRNKKKVRRPKEFTQGRTKGSCLYLN